MLADKDKQHFVVLIGEDGKAIIRTEKFQRTQSLSSIIVSIRENCQYDASFDIQRLPNDNHYFLVKDIDGKTLAVSDVYVNRHAVENKIKEVKKLANTAPMVYLPLVRSRIPDDE
jgi:uncharacterized protein YegP (UPF0339 family)